MRLLFILIISSAYIYANTFYYAYGKKIELTKVSNSRSNNNSIEYYQKQNGNKIGVKKRELLVKCNDGIDCKIVLSAYNFDNIEKISKTIFLVKLQNGQDVFKYSQILHQNSSIDFAHPNFVKKRRRR